MSRLPMFPLGTVLLPTAVLPLHVFEPRYRALMTDLLGDEGRPPPESEFGVVLIDRGSEVGGGDRRVPVGTVARLLEARQLPDGRWVIAVVGARRFRVERWLPDDPYPVGEVSDLVDEGAAPPPDRTLVAATARRVRRALALAAEGGEAGVPVTFELDDDPVRATWQLATLVPVGPMDRQRLLESHGPAARLELTGDLADAATELLARRLAGER